MALRHVRVRTAAVLTIVLAAAGVVAGVPAAHASDRPVSTANVTVPMVFPVVGGASYTDTFGAARSHGGHEGQDLMAPKMRKLVAVFDGTIGQISTRNGNYVVLNGANGWTAIYIHMNNDNPGTDDGAGTASWFLLPGTKVGTKLFAGQHIGWTGDSGNAESTAPHTHFELVRGPAWSGTVYDPYLSLKSAKVITRPYLSGPHQSGALVYAPWRGTWVLKGGKKYRIHVASMDARGLTPAHRIRITPGEMASYPVGGWLPLPEGLVTRDTEGRLWVIRNGGRVAVPSGTSLARLGTTAARVVDLATGIIVRTPLSADQSTPGVVRPGALVMEQGTTRPWYIDGTVRRTVPNPWTSASWGWDETKDVTMVAAGALRSVPISTDVKLKDGTVFKDPKGAYWLVTAGTKRAISRVSVREAYGYDLVWRTYGTAWATGLLPTGAPLP
jgi:hypothetical protein